MIGALLLAALAVPSSTTAAAQPAPASAAPGAPARRSIKLSPQGTEIVKQWAAEKDPELAMLVQQQRALSSQMQMLIGASKIDVVKLEALLKQQEGLQSAMRQRRDARLLALVKALPEADRSLFLKGLQPPAAGTGASAGSSPPK